MRLALSQKKHDTKKRAVSLSVFRQGPSRTVSLAAQFSMTVGLGEHCRHVASFLLRHCPREFLEGFVRNEPREVPRHTNGGGVTDGVIFLAVEFPKALFGLILQFPNASVEFVGCCSELLPVSLHGLVEESDVLLWNEPHSLIHEWPSVTHPGSSDLAADTIECLEPRMVWIEEFIGHGQRLGVNGEHLGDFLGDGQRHCFGVAQPSELDSAGEGILWRVVHVVS